MIKIWSVNRGVFVRHKYFSHFLRQQLDIWTQNFHFRATCDLTSGFVLFVIGVDRASTWTWYVTICHAAWVATTLNQGRNLWSFKDQLLTVTREVNYRRMMTWPSLVWNNWPMSLSPRLLRRIRSDRLRLKSWFTSSLRDLHTYIAKELLIEISSLTTFWSTLKAPWMPTRNPLWKSVTLAVPSYWRTTTMPSTSMVTVELCPLEASPTFQRGIIGHPSCSMVMPTMESRSICGLLAVF